MKVSLKWLSSLVDIADLSAEDIAKKLTFAGVEVENITHLASGKGLVIGETLDVIPMPDSNHLHICKVDLGNKYGIKQIVCGAPNVDKHQKVIVARDGAILPNGEIKSGMLRGYQSEGMLCSLSELGLDKKYQSDEDIKGIAILNKDAPLGEEDVLGYLGLDDAILDLKILANRSDLMAMNNIAKEVSTLFSRKLYIEEAPKESQKPIDFKINIDTIACSQFSILTIKDIKVKESPRWLVAYLRSMGVRSINNIVDIGNYIMLLTGQPLHMYDLDKLDKHELTIRSDYDGEFVALDEKTYKLIPNDIVIMSNNKVMCLGGVMGSLACAVDENSKNIAIEAANFNFSNIRHTSSRLGLVSESSQRFVKGINAVQYDYVLLLAAKYICEICDGKDVSKIATVDNRKHNPIIIKTSINKINNRLGTNFSKTDIVDVLVKDHMEIEEKDDCIYVKVPDYRIDMTCDADVSEEVIRLLGYEHVQSSLPTLSQSVGHMDDNVMKKRLLRDYLRGSGLNEVITYSLLSKKEVNKFNYVNKDAPYRIINPMTDEHEYMRNNILHSLLEIANYNVARQIKNLNYFEISEVDTPLHKESHLAIVLLGSNLYQQEMKQIPYSFYDMKGYLEGVMNILNIEPNRYTISRLISENNEFHPGKSASISIGKEIVGVLGELHPDMLKEYDLGKGPVIVMELKLDSLFSLRSGTKKFSIPNKYPSIARDLAIVLQDDISSKEVIDVIKRVDRSIIKDVAVFDEYRGENLEVGYKSLALSITYASDKETLKDEIVNELENKIILSLEKELHATLRK